jgi:hypothetical protein
MAGIVLLARGHGYGHAARDLQIIRGLRQLRPNAEVVLASSASGVEYFRFQGIPCHDLGIEDRRDLGEQAVRRVWGFLQTLRDPDLVIADEVVWALPFCRRFFGCPRVLLTDWLYADHGMPQHDPFLNSASEILVLDFAEAHPGPYDTQAPITFTGPVVSKFPSDRYTARKQLGVGTHSRMAVVSAGGVADRPDARRIFTHTAEAWSAYADPADVLFVLGVGYKLPGMPGNIRLVTHTPSPEVYYQAADAVVTDSTGLTCCEVVANGIPAVAMITSDALRFARLYRARASLLESVRGAVTAPLHGTIDVLWEALTDAMGLPHGSSFPAAPLSWATGLDVAARLLASCMAPVTANGARPGKHLPAEGDVTGAGQPAAPGAPL